MKAGDKPSIQAPTPAVKSPAIEAAQAAHAVQAAATVTPASTGPTLADQFVAHAMKFEGQPYAWNGGHNDKTEVGPVDCSGLVLQAARMAGLNLDGAARHQQKMGKSIPLDIATMKPGDLVFKGKPATHVGIYLGNGQVLHAPETGTNVTVTDMAGWTSARRVIPENAKAPAAVSRRVEAPAGPRGPDMAAMGSGLGSSQFALPQFTPNTPT